MKNYWKKILQVILIISGGLIGAGLCFAFLRSNLDDSLLGIIMFILLIPSAFFIEMWHTWHLPPYGDSVFALILIVPTVQFFLMGGFLAWWIIYLRKKKAKRTLRTILIVFILIAFCSIGDIFYRNFPTNSRITNSYCDSVVRGLKVIIEFENKNLFDQKKKLEEIGDRDSLEINKCLTSIFKTLENSDYFARNQINVNDLTKGGELFYDAYGSPLYFMNTNSLLFKKINHERIMEWGTHYPFVVWSAGKNKTNEFGYGDDIMPYQ